MYQYYKLFFGSCSYLTIYSDTDIVCIEKQGDRIIILSPCIKIALLVITVFNVAAGE